MNIAGDILAALDIPRTAADIRERVIPTLPDFDRVLKSLVTGCYVKLDGALYRRSTREERERWYRSAPPTGPPGEPSKAQEG